jgi:hypothetical protein
MIIAPFPETAAPGDHATTIVGSLLLMHEAHRYYAEHTQASDQLASFHDHQWALLRQQAIMQLRGAAGPRTESMRDALSRAHLFSPHPVISLARGSRLVVDAHHRTRCVRQLRVLCEASKAWQALPSERDPLVPIDADSCLVR